MAIEPGDAIAQVTICYAKEDDEAIFVDTHTRVNDECNPDDYLHVIISSLQGVVDQFKAVHNARVMIKKAPDN